MRKKKAETEMVDVGSGDVLVDLGFPDADERKLRVQLAMRLNELIADRHLTQARVAELFGIPQPHVSELKNYKLNRFSSERLLHFVTLLDRDVEIIIRPKAEGHASGVVSVSVARCYPGSGPLVSPWKRQGWDEWPEIGEPVRACSKDEDRDRVSRKVLLKR